MERTETKELHCESCLRGAHRTCRIYTPAEWEGGGGRCVCKCVARVDSRLTNVERAAGWVRQKPGPKAQPKTVAVARPPRVKREKTHAHDYGRPTKWSDERIRQLVCLQGEGLSSRQIAERLGDGTHMDTVRTYLCVARKKGITA